MGNCLQRQQQQDVNVVGHHHGIVLSSTRSRDKELNIRTNDSTDGISQSMHSRMVRERKKIPVYDIYEKVALLGSGSMGYIEEVRVRPGREGGSAFRSSRQQQSSSSSTSASKPQHASIVVAQSSTISNSSISSTGLSERRKAEVHYALKSIILDRISTQFTKELKNEILILREMDHPNLVKAYETFDYKKQIFIVMELLNGGDLYSRSPYNEKDSAKITGKMLSAIKYMHDHGIVHRDSE